MKSVRFFVFLVVIQFIFLSKTNAEIGTGQLKIMPTKIELKKKLTDIQYKVTQEEGTEPPFKNLYWDHKAEGIYVDIVSGEPLFSSRDKYDSGTGWPSFFKVIDSASVIEKKDRSLFSERTEVKSKIANSHLGHVFNDGPAPTGLRYCMNSAALRFVPKEKLAEEGYGKFLNEFTQTQVAVFAGGCFWCMQPPFDALIGKGVISTIVGYTGGHVIDPTYEQTSSGTTGHFEAIEVTFDPQKIKYTELLSVFWKNIDPYNKKGQFCDQGEVYKSAIFYKDEEQKKNYEHSLKDIEKLGIKLQDLATQILPHKVFYTAEEYHQKYYQKNPVKYKFYRFNCGRDKRLKEVWKK